MTLSCSRRTPPAHSSHSFAHVPHSFLYDIELQLRILHDPADFEKLVVKAATSAEEVKVAVSKTGKASRVGWEQECSAWPDTTAVPERP